MTKTLKYDLHFEKGGVIAATDAGQDFLWLNRGKPYKYLYDVATEQGLHCSFESLKIKNNLVG